MEVTKGQPKGLGVLFFSEMWERFSYYGMRALLVFYMTRHFRFGDTEAYAVYGTYTALVYATPVIGGLLADRLLGFRKAVVTGGVLMALGHFAMAFEQEQIFYLALALLICGNGFFKPNISSIVGRLYEKDDPRRDSGFTLFYMGINLGAGASPLVCGYLGETYGWKYGFGLAGVGMVVGLTVFLNGQRHLGHIAEPPHPGRLKRPMFVALNAERVIYLATAAAVLFLWQLVQHGALVGSLLIVFGAVVLVSILVYLMTRCDSVERARLSVALVLIFFSIAFWAFFEQAGSSMNLFTERNVDRTFLGITIRPSIFQSVNPAFILLLGPVFSALWIRLAKMDKEPRTSIKFALGLVQLGLGFAALYWGAKSSRGTGIVPVGWLFLGYFLHTTGELCLSPVGLSMITKLSPPRIVGLMMGTWFLSSAFAQYIAGLIAMLTGVHESEGGGAALPPPAQTVMVYGHVFGQVAWVALALGVTLLALAPLLNKGMRGIH